MTLIALAAAVALGIVVFMIVRSRRSGSAEVARDTTPALDRWLAEALELELAKAVLGFDNSTPEERKRLAKTLGNEPDPEVVGKIEDKVKAVELEFVKYAHETDAEVTVRVRYENGDTGATTKRLSWSDVPEAIRTDFDKKASTRVFRTWTFPWQRATAL
jgi:hypothetical protein